MNLSIFLYAILILFIIQSVRDQNFSTLEHNWKNALIVFLYLGMCLSLLNPVYLRLILRDISLLWFLYEKDNFCPKYNIVYNSFIVCSEFSCRDVVFKVFLVAFLAVFTGSATIFTLGLTSLWSHIYVVENWYILYNVFLVCCKIYIIFIWCSLKLISIWSLGPLGQQHSFCFVLLLVRCHHNIFWLRHLNICWLEHIPESIWFRIFGRFSIGSFRMLS